MARITILLLLTTFGYGQQKMTLADAIKRGLQNNYDIRIARNQADIAANGKGFGLAAFLPSLTASAGTDVSTSDLETNNPFRPGGRTDSDSRNASVSLSWTLFDGFGMFADRKRFDQLAKLGEVEAKNIIEGKIVQISRAYFDLVQQRQLSDVAQNTRDISEERLNKERVRRELGGASSTDFLNAQVAFNQDQAVLLNLELQVLIAQKDLNVLLAQKPATILNVDTQVAVPALDSELADLTRMAQERNSILALARQGKLVADQESKLARAAFLPDLSLNASYGLLDQTSSTGTDNTAFPPEIDTRSTDGRIALTLSFNLFNGFRDRITLQNARITARNQELLLLNLQNEIAGLVHEKVITFQKRLELLQLEEQNLVAAAQSLRLMQEKYQTGATTSLEFRDAQVNHSRAQSTLIAARYEARIARLEIEQITGTLQVE